MYNLPEITTYFEALILGTLPMSSKAFFTNFMSIVMPATASNLGRHSAASQDEVGQTDIEESEDAIQVLFPCSNLIAINRDSEEPLPKSLLLL
jgi:hypothetical protein